MASAGRSSWWTSYPARPDVFQPSSRRCASLVPPRMTAGERVPATSSSSAGSDARGDGGRERDRGGSGDDAASPRRAPTPVVGREHLVVVVAVGRHRARIDDRRARRDLHRHAVLHARGLEQLQPGAGVATHVVAHVDRVRATRERHVDDALGPPAAPGDEAPADGAQLVVEIDERLEQEAGAIRAVEPAGEDGVVEDEERHDQIGGLRRPGQRGVVRDPEVAGEDDDGDTGHAPDARRYARSCQVRSAMPASALAARARAAGTASVATDEQCRVVHGE